MADIFKALVIFCFGFVFLSSVGNAIERRSAVETTVIGTHAVASTPDRKDLESEPVLEKPLPATKPVARSGSYAQICASFDPVAHPEQVLDILEYASQSTGTPVDVLYAIWRNETGHVDGAGKASGGCDVAEQLKLRCVYGGSCKHEAAMYRLAERFQWNLQNMTCSCGTATWGNDTRYYGGCCGPFQFSFAEIDDNALAHGLDPMTFCGGAVLAGWELKEHHDRFLKKGVAKTDGEAWRRAVSRYFGADREGKYWRKAYAQWDMFHDWYRQGPGVVRQKVTEKSMYSARYHRKLRAASNAFASNP